MGGGGGGAALERERERAESAALTTSEGAAVLRLELATRVKAGDEGGQKGGGGGRGMGGRLRAFSEAAGRSFSYCGSN
jgi:hypothetical protein